MSGLSDPTSIKKLNVPTIEEIEMMADEIPQTQIYEMTPQEMIAKADAMEFGTYRGAINLGTSWEETIKQLRESAYKQLNNNH